MKRSRVGKPAAFCAAALMAAQVIGTANPTQAQVVEKLTEPVMEVFPSEESAEPEDEGKEASFGNVKQQVDAPETYAADFSETLPVEGEDREIVLHVTSDIPVEVPEADAIRLKKASWATREEALEATKKWEGVFGGGAEGTLLEIEDGRVCEILVEAEEEPYRVSTFTGNGEQPENYYSYTMDVEKYGIEERGFRLWESGELLEKLDKTEQEEQAEIAARIDKTGIGAFQIRKEGPVVMQWAAGLDNQGEPVNTVVGNFYRCERLVDGVPVTWVPGQWWFGEEEDGTEGVDGEAVNQPYREESLTASYLHGRMTAVYYDGIMKVEDYSDEKLFLLPFEEIRQIFENTVADSVMTMPWGLPLHEEVEIKYPENEAQAQADSAGQQKTLELKVKRVVLGYMRVPDKKNPDTGILIPVWDFTGGWTVSEGAAGTEEYSFEEVFPILTVDARDGSIVQRWEI